MNRPSPPPDYDPLSSLLRREWKVSTELPPRFEERVWTRIASSETTETAADWRKLLIALFTRPFAHARFAASYALVMLLAGLGVGLLQVRKESARVERQLGLRYVRSIDPYQAHHH
jgi:hypothetical protein